MKSLLIHISLVCLLCLPSCEALQDLEAIEEITFGASYAFPVINSTLTLEDFLQTYREDATLTADESGLLQFDYEEEVFSRSGKTILAEIATNFPQTIPVPLPLTELPAGTINGVSFERLDMASGTLGYSFASAHNKSLQIEIVFPELQKDGEVLRLSHELPAWSGTGVKPSVSTGTNPIDLSGYRLLTPAGKFSIRYTAIDPDGTSVVLENFLLGFQSPVFSLAQGYLGQFPVSGTGDRLSLDFFKNKLNGEVRFEAPLVSLISENGIGLPSRIQINRFDVLTTAGETLSLQSTLAQQDFDVPYPAMEGSIAEGRFTLDRNNSNVADLLSSGPVAIDYDIEALVNPDEDTGISGFVSEEANYRLSMDVSLPFFGSLSDFSARDTTEIDPETFSEFDEAEFKVVTDNGLPLGVMVQGYFVDDNFRIVNTLFDASLALARAAPVDGSGQTTGRNEQVNFVSFDKEKLDSIETATRLILVATFASAEAGNVPVKIFDYQDLGIRMGVILTKNN